MSSSIIKNLLLSFLLLTMMSQAKKVDTLSLWAMPNGPGSGDLLRELLVRFETETSIPVVLKELNWETAFDEIHTAFREGRGPDVLQLGSSWIPFFVRNGFLDSLQSIIEELDSDRFFEESVKFSRVGDDSTYYTVPWFLDVRALFANKAILDSIGIRDAHMTSFSRARGVMRMIAQNRLKNENKERIVPFGLPGKNDWTGPQVMAPWIWSYGGQFVKKEDSVWKSALLDSNTLNGLFHYLTLLHDTACVPYALFENSSQNANRFINSEQVFLMGTSEIIRKIDLPIKEGGFKEKNIGRDGIVLLPMPFGPKGHFTFVGSSHLAVSKQAKKKAKDLLQFLVRVDNIDAYTRRIGFLPSDKSAINVWSKDPRYNCLIENLEHGRSFPNIAEWGDIEQVLIEMSNDIGSIYRHAIEDEDRTLEVARLIVLADKKINAILSFDSLEERNTDSLLLFTEKILKQKVKEEDFLFVKLFPKGFLIPLPGQSWTFRFAVLIGIALTCLLIFFIESRYRLIRRRKKK